MKKIGDVNISDESIKEALSQNHGLIKLAAESLNVTRDTIYKRIRSTEEVRKVFVEARENILDKVESKLVEAAETGTPWAIQFLLKNIGRTRGYGDSLVIQASVANPPVYDLTKLDTDELKQLEALYKKIETIDGEVIDGEIIENIGDI